MLELSWPFKVQQSLSAHKQNIPPTISENEEYNERRIFNSEHKDSLLEIDDKLSSET